MKNRQWFKILVLAATEKLFNGKGSFASRANIIMFRMHFFGFMLETHNV